MSIWILSTIPGFRHYIIDTRGNIYSRKTQGSTKGTIQTKLRKLKLSPRKGKHLKSDYLRVYLTRNGHIHYKLVHKLVLETFVGPCPEGMECRHKNGIPSDNRLENLKWGTHKKNMQDKSKHGTHAKGERNPSSKLTEDQVKEIRKLYATGKYTQKQLSHNFKIARSGIGNIVNHKRWTHI